MAQNQIISFFIELFNRLRTKSPKIFRVLQLFSASLAFAGYVPSMLQRWLNVEVPGHLITMCEDIGKYATGFFIAAFLPVQPATVAQSETGEAIKVTDETKMPFTAKAESKALEKAVPPAPVVDVPNEPIND